MTGDPGRLAGPGRLRRRRRRATQRAAWHDADAAARPARLARLRDAVRRTPAIDAYFGVRREHMRYLTGFTLADGEEKVAGNSGQFLVGGDEVVVLADSRYTDPGPARGARGPRSPRSTATCRRAGPSSSRRIGAPAGRRSRPGSSPHATWERLAAAAPDVELVPGRGLARGGPGDARSRPRSSASPRPAPWRTARSPALLPEIRPGVTEARPGAAPGVADADRRRRGAGLRRRLPGGPGGGAAARLAGRPAGRSTGRSCCSTSGRRSAATAAT